MVEMGCTKWEAGLISSDISVSPSIVMPRRSTVVPPNDFTVLQVNKVLN